MRISTSQISGSRSMHIRQQQGAALMVGLIMLLLLTLIGVAGMRDTLLQEKMTGNMRDREIALQAAESALRDGEAIAGQPGTPPVFNNNNGTYDRNTALGKYAMRRMKSGTPVAEPTFWKKGQVWKWDATDSVAYSHALPDVASQPRYVIEAMEPTSTDTSEYTGEKTAVSHVGNTGFGEVADEVAFAAAPDYRITARGVGLTEDSAVILQSTFRRAPTKVP